MEHKEQNEEGYLCDRCGKYELGAHACKPKKNTQEKKDCKCGGGGIYDVHLETCTPQVTENWEEEFNTLFEEDKSGKNSVGIQYIDAPVSKIKSFIQDLLASHEQSYREKLVEEIEGKLKFILNDIDSGIKFIKSRAGTSLIDNLIVGKAIALDEVLSIIKSHKK